MLSNLQKYHFVFLFLLIQRDIQDWVIEYLFETGLNIRNTEGGGFSYKILTINEFSSPRILNFWRVLREKKRR